MDYRDAVLFADLLTDGNKIACIAADLIVDPVAGLLNGRCSAVHERDAHRDGPDVEMLFVEHLHRFNNLVFINHKNVPLSKIRFYASH